MVRVGDDGVYQVENVALSGQTIVHDVRKNYSIMRIEGVVVLPVGAEIKRESPRVNAKAVRVRLLTGLDSYPVGVCLDVEVPDEWWSDARPAPRRAWT